MAAAKSQTYQQRRQRIRESSPFAVTQKSSPLALSSDLEEAVRLPERQEAMDQREDADAADTADAPALASASAAVNGAALVGGASSPRDSADASPDLTPDLPTRTVTQKVRDLYNAQNFQGMLDLKVEACEIAAAWKSTGTGSAAARIYLRLGTACSMLKQHKEAMGMYEEAMAIFEELSEAEGETKHRREFLTCCCNLAVCCAEQSQGHKALKFFDRAMVLAEETGDMQITGGIITNFGGLCQQLGQYEKAITLNRRALVIAEETPWSPTSPCTSPSGNMKDETDPRLFLTSAPVAVACQNLARCYKCLGQFEEAIEFGERGEAIMKELCLVTHLGTRDHDGLTVSWRCLGECWASLGNYAEGIKYHKKYWALSQQLGLNIGKAQSALDIGVTLLTQGLAEHHASVAAADSADGGLQMQMRSATSLADAKDWLTAAVKLNYDDESKMLVLFIATDAYVNLAFVSFLMNQEARALEYLRAHLDILVRMQPGISSSSSGYVRDTTGWCSGCEQQQVGTRMLACGGCKVARSVLQLLPSSHHITYLVHNCHTLRQCVWMI
jgi:tetratricopeptide (TPR) repeat protein